VNKWLSDRGAFISKKVPFGNDGLFIEATSSTKNKARKRPEIAANTKKVSSGSFGLKSPVFCVTLERVNSQRKYQRRPTFMTSQNSNLLHSEACFVSADLAILAL